LAWPGDVVHLTGPLNSPGSSTGLEMESDVYSRLIVWCIVVQAYALEKREDCVKD